MAYEKPVGCDYHAALLACRDGDVLGLKRLYDANAGYLFAVATRVVGRREVAEDVLHDAFIQIWRGAATFDPKRGSPRTWMLTIVRHAAYRAMRNDRRVTPLDEAALARVPDEARSACDLAELADDAEGLKRCLAELEANKRDSIMLAYVHGLTHSEIASRTGAPLGSVKAWIRRGLGDHHLSPSREQYVRGGG